MSCWHDPRGRLIVDGEGRTVRRVAALSDVTYVWGEGRNWLSWDACEQCHGMLPIVYARGRIVRVSARHSCRPERRR